MGDEEKDLNASNGALVHSIKYFAVWTGCRRIGCERTNEERRRRAANFRNELHCGRQTRRRSLVAAPRSFVVSAFVPLNKSRLGN